MKSEDGVLKEKLELMDDEALCRTVGGLTVFPMLAGRKLGEIIAEKLDDWFERPPD